MILSELSRFLVHGKERWNIIKAQEFDNKFEAGEDLNSYLDFSKARRVNQECKRVNIDFPFWVVDGLDKQAKRLGISRQALVKFWIAEKLKTAAGLQRRSNYHAENAGSLHETVRKNSLTNLKA